MESQKKSQSNPGTGGQTRLRKIPEVAAILAWILPGLGHFYLGYRAKAAIILCAILLAFVVGIVLADFEAISIPEHKYAFFAQIGTGGPSLLVLFVTGGETSEPERTINPLHSIGLLYTMVAGLLNFVVACDAYERATRDRINVA